MEVFMVELLEVEGKILVDEDLKIGEMESQMVEGEFKEGIEISEAVQVLGMDLEVVDEMFEAIGKDDKD